MADTTLCKTLRPPTFLAPNLFGQLPLHAAHRFLRLTDRLVAAAWAEQHKQGPVSWHDQCMHRRTP